MTTPIIASVQDVSKRFTIHQQRSLKERIVNSRSARAHKRDFWALSDINLDINFGTTVGLVGHNGSGKSTLLKIIGGIIAPTSGTVTRRGRMAALLELGAGFHADLTGRENVYLNASILGLSTKEINAVFDEIVDFSGIEQFIDTQVKFYSSGMYVRLAFAVAVHVDPDLLLVDEVLAVGDELFQEKCINKISEFQREGRTIVVVTHSAAQVKQLCDRVVVLDHGKMIFDGDTSEGIRVLQGGYERDREATGQGPSNSVVATPQQQTFISSMSVTASEEGITEAFPSGSDLHVNLAYKIEEDAGPLVAELLIESAQRELVYCLDTRMLGKAIPNNPGEHKLAMTLRDAAFGEGTYVARGRLWTAAGELLNEIAPSPTFVIEDAAPGSGFVSIHSTIDVV